MATALKKIAEIRTGHLFRKRIEYNGNGDKSVIRPTDMNNYTSEVDYENLKRISEAVSDDTILGDGDIIIKAKGYNNRAVSIVNNRYPLVPTSHFIIIRVKYRQVDPRYLAWFLNQKSAQLYFKTMTGGTSIPNLKIKTLSQLKVHIPPLDIQEKVIKVSGLLEKERVLVEKIMTTRKSLTERILLKAIEKGSGE